MDVTWARIAFTLLVIVSFFIIVWIACGRQSKERYDDIAKQIVDDNDSVEATVPKSHSDETEHKE